ncbi:MAG: DUF5103 domain-containing protein [Bacteroidales bacterium]|jgi:hypothetical protein|nr:DUF5103 domain-containing protein [Bacteroidales bacterium]
MKGSLFYKVFGLITASGFCASLQAQYEPPDGIYPDAVFVETIKTVRWHKPEWEMVYPVIRMDDEEPLMLSFDELTQTAKNYAYNIIHCDAGWKQSRLVHADYMEGFTLNYLTDYEYSFNTLIPYVHYRIQIPNRDVALKLSGNYVVMVFEDGEEEHPVMCKRFSIAESLVTVTATAGRARQTAYQEAWQQVDFLVHTLNYPIENAYQDVQVTVLKNGQWHTALTGIKPLFVRQNELDYRQEKAALFPAGNEYRPLDIKSTRYTSTRMNAIVFEQPAYHFYPQPDEPRNTSRYLFHEDFNGKYSIQSEKTTRHDVAADYVYVHFALQTPQRFENGQVYVSGAFCNYACAPDNVMAYDRDKRQYEARILLKQGYYNYQYVFLPFKNPVMDDIFLEGTFSDTENDYIIYVYHRGRLSRYDRLIGFTVVNSLHR